MGRDLSVYKRLLHSGRTPNEILGAIRHVREVIPSHGPLSMLALYHSNATPIFERALHRHHLAEEGKRKERGKLPPSIRQVLREMVS